MRESDIEALLARGARGMGGLAVKHVSPGRAGDPDRLVALPVHPCPECGRRAAVGLLELKRPGERPRPLQLARIDQWESIGVRAAWADTPARVEQFLKGLK